MSLDVVFTAVPFLLLSLISVGLFFPKSSGPTAIGEFLLILLGITAFFFVHQIFGLIVLFMAAIVLFNRRRSVNGR